MRAAPVALNEICRYNLPFAHPPIQVDGTHVPLRKALMPCHLMGEEDSFPVNACEAKSRRLARYFRMGHTPVEMRNLAALDPNAPLHASAEFSHTLDLRRV